MVIGKNFACHPLVCNRKLKRYETKSIIYSHFIHELLLIPHRRLPTKETRFR